MRRNFGKNPIMEDKKHELISLKAELEELQPQLEKTYRWSSEYRALASKAVPKLIELLDDPAKAVGKAALEALPAIGDQARPAQGTLVDMLKDPSPEVRAAAARGLAIAGESASRAIEALSGMKASGGLVYNIAIGRAKKEFAEGQKGKVAGLKPLVSDPDPKVRRAVQEALAKIKEG